MKLIIGLGNPGIKYKKTRHNIGFLVLDELADRNKFKALKNIKADFVKININDQEVELIKPQTFMNNSGIAVAQIAKKNYISSEDIIVIHDDKDLEFGKIKIQKDASAAGHNGIKSIIEHLGTQNFWRIRIGVANSDLEKIPTDKFVLAKFNKEEKKQLPQIIKKAIEELVKLL